MNSQTIPLRFFISSALSNCALVPQQFQNLKLNSPLFESLLKFINIDTEYQWKWLLADCCNPYADLSHLQLYERGIHE